MNPGLVFNIDDQSGINKFPNSEEKVTAPLFAQTFTSDKGTEDVRECYGDEFFAQYGDISYAKHGQPLLQAAISINAGARVLCKRIVAEDSALANIIVMATVTKRESQKTDADGQPLYKTPTGEESITAEGNTAIMLTKAVISYTTNTVADNKNDINSLKSSAYGDGDFVGKVGETATYPLFVITDNGRGLSSKKVRIAADFANSKTVEYIKYMIQVIEGVEVSEQMYFTFNPDTVLNNINTSFESVIKSQSSQIKGFIFEDAAEAMIKNIAAISGINEATLKNYDILFAHDKKGKAIENIVIEGDVDLSKATGIQLASGSNGTFGDRPNAQPTEVSAQMVKFFNGTFDQGIWDVDNIKLDAIVDANYDVSVKRAIEQFVNFREDCFYFRDLGIGLREIDDILASAADASKSRYSASFCNSYDVIDPYSKKQISVTIGYSLARILVDHFNNGCNRPTAGMLHDFTFPEIIEGTLNFQPRVIPGYDQKEVLYDNRVNFVSYFDGVAVMESEYTCQEKYSAFSWVNNTLAIQEVIKAIRTKCPKIRYSFMEGEDLERYLEDINQVVNTFSSNFSSIKCEYASDKNYESNNIFYAVITVSFKKFVQTEMFKITAIS